MTCEHPVEKLVVEPSGTRFLVKCVGCDSAWAGGEGIALVVRGFKRNEEEIWRALESVGATRPRGSQRSCDHPIGLITVESSGGRGQTGTFLVRCRGCKGSWKGGAALAEILGSLRRDREDIWAEIKRLGG